MCRCEGLTLPSLAENYLLDDGSLKGLLQAAEHRGIMQLMPFAALFAAHDTVESAGLPYVEIIISYDTSFVPSCWPYFIEDRVLIRC